MRTDENSKFTLHKTMTQDWYNADEVDKRITELESTRVPDELLQWLFDKATYAGAWGEKYDQVQEIVERRKDGE